MVCRFAAIIPIACAAVVAAPALALDMPARKAGLWELRMQIEGQTKMVQVMKHCVDAATDKLMNSQMSGSSQNCPTQNIVKTGNVMTIDSVCEFGGATVRSHSVVTGSFDSAYTVDVNSKREGGRPMPGLAPDGSTHMKVAATWLGPCAAGQKPGDIMMPNGMTMNVLDLQRGIGAPPRRP